MRMGGKNKNRATLVKHAACHSSLYHNRLAETPVHLLLLQRSAGPHPLERTSMSPKAQLASRCIWTKVAEMRAAALAERDYTAPLRTLESAARAPYPLTICMGMPTFSAGGGCRRALACNALAFAAERKTGSSARDLPPAPWKSSEMDCASDFKRVSS